MKWGRWLLVLLGIVTGAFLVYWWMEIRMFPTLRISHTLGKGNEVSIEWIEVN